MNSYYECHITVEDPNYDWCRILIENMKWKYSRIDGDPIMGPGVKQYATRHYNSKLDKEKVLDELFSAANELIDNGIKVTRRKIELVIWDDRSSKITFACDGACPECHLDDINEKSVFVYAREVAKMN